MAEKYQIIVTYVPGTGTARVEVKHREKELRSRNFLDFHSLDYVDGLCDAFTHAGDDYKVSYSKVERL
jgi:hypothetical protein